MPTAYSYIRFSDTKQKKGTSVDRQIRERDIWLKKNPEWTLDTTISLKDLGVSAFRGRNLNPEYGDLGKFIDLCERENSPIEKGSILLLEKLDRFSRHEPMLALTALGRLIYAGIRVIATEDKFEISEDNINNLGVILPVVLNLCIAHKQSEEKSYRVSKYWLERREAINTKSLVITKRLPSWLFYDEQTKSIMTDESKADSIRYIFKRTIEGVGQVVLVRELNANFKPITESKNKKDRNWNTSYLSKVLNDRSVLGEFQPKTRNKKGSRVDIGLPIKDYFPRIVTDQDFYSAQYQKQQRKKDKSDARKTFVNLFSGLVVNVHDNQVMHIQTSRTRRDSGEVYVQRRLWSYGKIRGLPGASQIGLDYFHFEKIVLSALSELNPQDFQQRWDGDNERRNLYQEICGYKIRIKELEELLIDLDVATASSVVKSISDINMKLDAAQKRHDAIAGVKSQSSTSIVEGIKDLTTFCAMRDNDGDKNTRNKIQGLIPSIVEKIEVKLSRCENRRIIASGTIYLTNKQIRDFYLWPLKQISNHPNILFCGNANKPAIKLTSCGSIFWSGWHGTSLDSSAVVDEKTGEPKREFEARANWITSKDLFGNPVFYEDEKAKCGDDDLAILNHYLKMQDDVFSSATW